jgi:hypothetical protein
MHLPAGAAARELSLQLVWHHARLAFYSLQRE